MLKVRYINHETLYLTSERVHMIKSEKKILLRLFLDDLVPLLTHPYVKFAEEVNLRIRDSQTLLFFQTYSVLIG